MIHGIIVCQETYEWTKEEENIENVQKNRNSSSLLIDISIFNRMKVCGDQIVFNHIFFNQFNKCKNVHWTHFVRGKQRDLSLRNSSHPKTMNLMRVPQTKPIWKYDLRYLDRNSWCCSYTCSSLCTVSTNLLFSENSRILSKELLSNLIKIWFGTRVFRVVDHEEEYLPREVRSSRRRPNQQNEWFSLSRNFITGWFRNFLWQLSTNTL